MAFLLTVKAGQFEGKIVTLQAGRAMTFGRAEGRAEFAVPDDKQMSGVHFVVECGASGCRVIDEGSTNGTFLNGARIREAMLLANGDEIKAGATTFVVRIVPDHQPTAPAPRPQAASAPPVVPSPQRTEEAGPLASSAKGQERPMQVPTPARPLQGPSISASDQPRPGVARLDDSAPKRPPPSAPGGGASAPQQTASGLAQPSGSLAKQAAPGVVPTVRPVQPPALAIGSWAFLKIPERWQIQEGLGIQQIVKDAFPASIVVMEEMLGVGMTLAQYVEAQSKMLRENLPAPKVDSAAAPAIAGSVETVALEVRFTLKDGPAVFFHRVYASNGAAVGVLNFTCLEKDLAAARPVYNAVLSAVSFSPKG